MARFVDEYLDDCVPGYPTLSSPRFSTSLVSVDSGAEQANQRWEHPLNKYTLPEAVRSMEVFNAVRDHWLVMRGPAHTWPFRDPLDFASIALARPNTAPTITMTDCVLGTGDGVTRAFQITKTYARGAQTYTRNIKLPVVSSVLVAVTNGSGVPTLVASGYSVSRPGGVITFDAAPIAGRLISCGYLFDVPVRFEADDSFDGIVRTFGVSGFSDLTFSEVRV